MKHPLIRILCLPDIDRPIGGVKQLFRHVEHLVSLGWDAAIVSEKAGFRPSWFTSNAIVFSLDECHMRGDFNPSACILVLPETYLAVNLSNFYGVDLSNLYRVIFNQNAYYTYCSGDGDLSSLLSSFYFSPLTLHTLVVSEDSHNLLRKNLNIPDLRLSRVVNSVETIFSPSPSPSNIIHWMPRKNPDHVKAILSGLVTCQLLNSASWTGEALDSLPHESIASKLNSAKIFLSFGYPEGFGLPIAEAMASGCWVIGYSGGGGKELFQYGASDCVEFGDWTSFITAIQKTLEFFHSSPREVNFRLNHQSQAIRSMYSYESERTSIECAWNQIEVQFNSD